MLCGIYLVVTALMARSRLEAARAVVSQLHSQLSAGDLAAARASASRLAVTADSAHALTTGPIWFLAAGIPYAGDPLATVRGITTNLDRLAAQVVPPVVQVANRITPGALRNADGSVNLGPIASAAPELDRADAALARARRSVSALPASTWLASADKARSLFASQLATLGGTVDTADTAAHVVPPMLGADGARTYLLVFQNDAEARGTGGLPGAFAVVSAAGGRLHFDSFHSDSEMDGVSAGVDLGAQYDQLYQGADTTSLFVNGNLSPHFPDAARIWSAMWQTKTGQAVDGVIAVDPTALSYLLAATGPVTAADGTVITASDVVELTQSAVYERYPLQDQNEQRRAYLLEIARAVSGKLAVLPPQPRELLREAGRGAGERRILVWSADPALEARLAVTPVGGTIPATAAPFVGMFVVNDGGNKLDYYLDRALTWQRSGCGSTRKVAVTMKLTNTAPASGLSPYVTQRSDTHGYPTSPGDNRLLVYYFATDGALMHAVTIDGRPTTATVGERFGHPVFVIDVEVPRGRTTTVTLALTEPVGTGPPVVLPQPLVRPLQVTVRNQSCG